MIICWIVALCALMWFLPSVNEGVGLQIASFHKWFVALRTSDPFGSTVGLLMIRKATFICKGLGTHITRILIRHINITSTSWHSLLMTGKICVNINLKHLNTFPFTNKVWGGWDQFLDMFSFRGGMKGKFFALIPKSESCPSIHSPCCFTKLLKAGRSEMSID